MVKQRCSWFMGVWLLWFLLILINYYAQVGQIAMVGPKVWVQQNHSLHQFANYLRLMLFGGASFWQFLAWKEALMRTVTAVWGTLIIFFAAQIVGAALLHGLRWQEKDGRDRFLYQTAVGLGLLSYLSFGLAGLGLYTEQSVTRLIGLIILPGTIWLLWKKPLTITRQKIKDALNPQTFFQQNIGYKLIIFSALVIGFIGALAPEIEYDALWYHLWLPQQWLQAGKPVDIISEYISLYPLTWELLYGNGLVVGNVITAKLIHFLTLPMTALLVYRLTQRFFPEANPWLATSLFITVPTILWQATTSYIDLALTFYTGLVLYAGLNFVVTQSRHWLILAILSMGMALAIKHLALPILLIFTTGLALWQWRSTHNWRKAMRLALLFAGLSLLIPFPWYLRNLLTSGNPVFPDMYALFGAFPVERWTEITERDLQHFKNRFGRSRTLLHMVALPWDATIHAARYSGTLGPLFLIFLPGLLLPARQNMMVRWLFSFAGLYLMFWASPLSSFQMRFLLPLVPVLALLGAVGFARLVNGVQNQWWPWGLALGMMSLLTLNLPPFTSLHEGDRQMWAGWLNHVIHEIPFAVVIGQETEEAYLASKVSAYRAWQYINRELPTNVRVLTFSGGDHFYSQRPRLAHDATMAHTAVWGALVGQETQARQRLEQLSISYILFDKQQLETDSMGHLAITQPAFLSTWLTRVYTDERFVLYEFDAKGLSGEN